MEIALVIVYWALVALCVFMGSAILFCWALFGIAKHKGFLTDDITPAQIIDRLTAPKEGEGK